ncbi:MAG: mechanosensitive ion channel family protein [Succinivibrionaceae bacterium]
MSDNSSNTQLWNDPIGYFTQNQEIIFNFCSNIIFALVILVLGVFIAKLLSKFALSIMNKAKIEPTVSKFISNITKYAIIAFMVTAALSKVGVETASFVAIIGAASFAIGMSLQGSLSNFASGVILLIFRPFKVGEYIDVVGQSGTVEEITIFTTSLLTTDNKIIIIPNSSISSGIITNYSRMDKRRVDFTFSIAYGSDIAKAKKTLYDMFSSDPRVLKDTEITVVIGSHGASSIPIICRVWVKGSDYWNVFFDSNEKALDVLKNAKIDIPFQTISIINQSK